MKSLALAAILAFASSLALAQTTPTLTFEVSTTTGATSVVPKLTWSTTPAAKSCSATDGWTGAKAAAGTETLAAITASKTYGMTCSWGDSSATLRWEPATQNTDGTPYTNAKGYRIRYGTSATALNQAVLMASPAVTSRVFDGLANGTWYFNIASVTTTDAESAPTAPPVSKVISLQTVTRSVAATVNPKPNSPGNLTIE